MINSPFNYTGSKFKLLPQILPHFDYTKKNFVDLFVGGGSVYANVIDKYETIIINDIILELVKTHYCLLFDDNFVDKVKVCCVSKEDQEGYNQLRAKFNIERQPEQLYALMLCCTSNLMRFNKKFEFNQTFGRRTFNPSTQKKIDEFVAHLKPYQNKIKYKSKHFSEIKLDSGHMVYIDPPYGLTTTGEAISEAGYNAYWKSEDDLHLCDYILNLNTNGHSFILSGLLEHNGKRSWLLNELSKAGFNHKILEKNYEKVARNKNKESVEVIVGNCF